MKYLVLAIFLGMLTTVTSAFSEAVVGQTAPSFSAIDSQGQTRSLSDYKGKFIVLEWLNHGCPFIRKHYESGNMQKLQATYTTKGVIWLSIASSAPGKEGYMTPEQASTLIQEKHSVSTAVLLDGDGKVGKLYGARTTPHMFVVDPSGKVIYNGAIDDHDSTRVASIAGAKNYVAQALDEAMAGKIVSEPNTEPYGCSIKYQS